MIKITKIYIVTINTLLATLFTGVSYCGLHQWQELQGIYNGSLSWGDYNSDGLLDLAVCGQTKDEDVVTKIYKNMGKPDYELQEVQTLTGIQTGGFAWGDYDNDGDLDLAICGNSGSGEKIYITKVYRNDNGIFRDSGLNLEGFAMGSLCWADIDNDGDLDLIIVGHRKAIPHKVIKIYKNDSNGNLSTGDEISATSEANFSLGDYDNDGDLDIVLCGYDVSLNIITKLYENNKGFFSESSQSFTGVRRGAIAWADYDNDSDLDFAVVGTTDAKGGVNYGILEVYRNDGPKFDVGFSTNGLVNYSSLAWGDYDNDGKIDLAAMGEVSASSPVARVLRIYRNNSSPGITDFSLEFTTDGVRQGNLAWADVDKDGDLDLAFCGIAVDTETFSGENYILRVYRNDEADNGNANTLPEAPEDSTFNTAFNNETNELTLYWGYGSDDKTSKEGLYYNFMVGSESGAEDIVSGRYGTPLLGNFLSRCSTTTVNGYRFKYTIKISSPSAYYWRVQTIDTGLGRSWKSGSAEALIEAGWSEEHVYEDTTSPKGLPLAPIDEGDYTYSQDITFYFNKGTANDPETGIHGCYLEVGTSPGANDVFSEEIGDVWKESSPSYKVSNVESGKTYYARIRAKHGYTGTSPTGDAPYNGDYTDWSESSDGIQVVEPLSVNNNLIHPGTSDDTVGISYFLIEEERVVLKIYDLKGRLIKTFLNNETKPIGSYTEYWKAKDNDGWTVGSGVYIVYFRIGDVEKKEKVVVVK